MTQFYVQYEVRRNEAIGAFWPKSDVVEANDAESARQAFRDKYRHEFEFRSPLACYTVEFKATHRYLEIVKNEWMHVEFIRHLGTFDAEVRTKDGSIHRIGKAFLEPF